MACEYGFVKDNIGCPICQCVDPPEEESPPLIGRPDGHELVATACDGRPMCFMFCEFGFKRDADGCEVCHCMDDPCQVTYRFQKVSK